MKTKNISVSNLNLIYRILPEIESYSHDFESITGTRLDKFLNIIYDARNSNPYSLDPSQSVIQDGTHYPFGLGLFRAILGRVCHKARLLGLKSISQQQYQFFEEGYVYIEDFLDESLYLRLTNSLRNCLQGGYMPKNSENYTSEAGGKGSTFVRSGVKIDNKIISMISDLVKHLLFLPEQKTGCNLVSHVHFANDKDTRFHLDNGGITTLKWFYFPFGCHPSDSGFVFCPNSNQLSYSKMNYLHQWRHYHSMTSKYPEVLGNYRFNQTSPDMECDIEKKYLLHLKRCRKLSFYKPNSIVLADTSAFHCRALARLGAKRITIQGGIDNSSSFAYSA